MMCVVEGGETKICFDFLLLASPMPSDAIDFNGSKFWHFCDMKEIEIWKSQERHVKMLRMCGATFGREAKDIVVNIIKPIHNNHKFFVELDEKKATNIKYRKKWEKSINSIKNCFSFMTTAEIDFRDFHFDLNLN
jgi:hypothetical protein